MLLLAVALLVVSVQGDVEAETTVRSYSFWKRLFHRITPKPWSTKQKRIQSNVAKEMNYMIKKYRLNNDLRQAHFLAQIFYESDHFRTTTEYHSGRNYDIQVNRKRALGLGNTQPGDGVRFRGRGLIQLTGRANYKFFGKRLGVNLLANPKKVAEFPLALEVSGDYWKYREINKYADRNSYRMVTKRVNGGQRGLAKRTRLTKKIYSILSNCVVDVSLIKEVQGFLKIKVDGQWGPKSQAALNAYEESKGRSKSNCLKETQVTRLRLEF